MKTNRKSVILLSVKSIFSLLLLFILTVIVHEGAHYITALILGIPIAHFTWFDPNYFAPAFFSGSTEHTTRMIMVGYAGGLATGVLLLAILLLKEPSLSSYYIGYASAVLGMFLYWFLMPRLRELKV